MKQILSFFIIILCFFPFSVYAEAKYIDCNISSEKGNDKFSVKLDEDSGKITHTLQNGVAFNANGFFSANLITYQRFVNLSGISVIEKFRINRTNLKAEKISEVSISDAKFANQVPASTTVWKGTCEIIDVKNRKI